MSPSAPAVHRSDALVRWLFLRAIGLIYLIAFVSLLSQVRGLVGSHGILPAQTLIETAGQYFDSQHMGFERYRVLPTLGWLSASDGALVTQSAIGAALALLATADIMPGLCLVLLWIVYLSLTVLGQDFFGFQWDSLLLETGFLAIFLAPWSWRPRLVGMRASSPIAMWLLRWLLFRLMFESGCVKLLSGDASWRHLTALTFHYETQPLPTWIGWYASQLPVWFQKISCAGVFVIELGMPFLIFTPRRFRLLGCAALAGLQVLILLTGNYTFFNGLCLALCVLLLDDAALLAPLPKRWQARLFSKVPSRASGGDHAVRRALGCAGAAVFTVLSLVPLAGMFGENVGVLRPVEAVYGWLDPLRTINGYGLFAVMTTVRTEIEVQGSNDGQEWRAYEFTNKPGDLTRRPGFVAPFQPRLDWQMWFAALGTWRENPWFTNFCERLLQGSPSVLGLLASNPFPDHPPRFIRAELYDYRFTDIPTKRATGAWWTRTFAGDYMPTVSLSR